MSKEINALFKEFEKTYGEDVNIKDINDNIEVVFAPTKRPSIDFVSTGGMPKGRIIRFSGMKSSGKSSAAISVAPTLGLKILLVDTEYTFTTSYAKALMGDAFTDKHLFKIVNGKTTEIVCDVIRKAIPHFDVIIWDSLQNSASMEEWQKTASEESRANRAKVLAKEIPKIIYLQDKYDTTMIVISQVSQNQERVNKYDAKYIVSGGEKLDHNTSLHLWFFPSTKEKPEGVDDVKGFQEIKGNLVRIFCAKNKCGPALRTVKTMFVFGEGYTIEDDVFAVGKGIGLIEGRYRYGDVKMGNSEVKAKQFLKDNPELCDELAAKITAYLLKNEEEFTTDENVTILNED